MIQRVLIFACLVACLASLVAMTVPEVSPAIFAAATLCVPSILIGLASLRRRRSWRDLVPAWVLLLLLQGTNLGLLVGAGSESAGAQGLPVGSWLFLIGFGSLPLGLLASWFAWDFDSFATPASETDRT